ncbi:MAG: DUF192 domain-containing protein [Wenzhouxiangellaceae bacterium]
MKASPGTSWWLFLVWVLLIGACEAKDPWVEVGGKRYHVEIADTPETRARGLMFRDRLDDDAGMLFIWPNSAPRSFWMRNTRIPLDIVYIAEDGRIVAWSLNTPPCRTRNCPSYPSGKPARFVLEVNAGQMERLGVRIGDPVRFGNIPGLDQAR